MMLNSFSRYTAVLLVAVSCYTIPAMAQPGKEKSKVTATKKNDRPSPPVSISKKVGDITVSINYSSPAVKGRTIWGDLVPYNKIWRTGADEATTVEVSRDCKVGGGMLKAGKYALFTIPGEKEWTIIFNGVPDQWGSYKYEENKDKDVLTFKVKPEASSEFNERLKFDIVSNEMGEGKIIILWENLKVPFEIR